MANKEAEPMKTGIYIAVAVIGLCVIGAAVLYHWRYLIFWMLLNLEIKYLLFHTDQVPEVTDLQ